MFPEKFEFYKVDQSMKKFKNNH